MPPAARVVAVLKSWLFVILVLPLLLAPQGAFAEQFGHHRFIDRIVVFGTSLSDPGNAFQLNGQINVGPPTFGMEGLDLLIRNPSAPYAIGDNHFSNGPTWIEQLAKFVRLEESVQPAMLGSDGVASNYAIGSSRAYVPVPDFDSNPLAPFISLDSQVGNFLADVQAGTRGVPRRALYVMEMGGNDLRQLLQHPGRADEIIGGAVGKIAETIFVLHSLGARKFFVWNAPDLGSTPALRVLDALADPNASPKPSEAVTGAAIAFNQFLEAALSSLDSLEDIEIIRFDTFAYMRAIVEHPRRFGLGGATDACIMPGPTPPFFCLHPDRQFFWDGIHATQAGHRVIAFLAGKTLLVELLQHD